MVKRVASQLINNSETNQSLTENVLTTILKESKVKRTNQEKININSYMFHNAKLMNKMMMVDDTI